MHRVLLLACLCACGTAAAPATDPGLPKGEPWKIQPNAPASTEAMPPADLGVASVSTLLHFALSSADIQVTVRVGEAAHVLRVQTAQGGFRTGNIDDLSFFRGYLLTSAEHLLSEDPKLAELVREHYFDPAAGGAQIVADVQSLTELERPLTVGATLDTTVVGRLQIGERLHAVTFPVRVTREANDVLHVVSSAPIVIPFAAFGRSAELTELGSALGGVLSADMEVALEARLEPQAPEDLPAYVRTGVTVQSVAEMQAEIGAADAALALHQQRLLEKGAPLSVVQAATPASLEAARVARERELVLQRMALGMDASREDRLRDPGLRVVRPPPRTGPPPTTPPPPPPDGAPPSGSQMLVPPQPPEAP